MTLSLDTAYRSFGGEVEASSTPTICRLPDSRRHQLWAIAHGGKTNSSPGRARHKPSSHCAGDAGVLRLYLYARVRIYLHHCTRDRGCSKHPAFPAPSQEGQVHANLGRRASRERETVSTSLRA